MKNKPKSAKRRSWKNKSVD